MCGGNYHRARRGRCRRLLMACAQHDEPGQRESEGHAAGGGGTGMRMSVRAHHRRCATNGTIHNYPNLETANEHGEPQRLAGEGTFETTRARHCCFK